MVKRSWGKIETFLIFYRKSLYFLVIIYFFVVSCGLFICAVVMMRVCIGASFDHCARPAQQRSKKTELNSSHVQLLKKEVLKIEKSAKFIYGGSVTGGCSFFVTSI